MAGFHKLTKDLSLLYAIQPVEIKSSCVNFYTRIVRTPLTWIRVFFPFPFLCNGSEQINLMTMMSRKQNRRKAKEPV